MSSGATSPPLCIDVLEAVAPVFSLRLLASEVTALAILLNCFPFLGHEKWEAFGVGMMNWTPG